MPHLKEAFPSASRLLLLCKKSGPMAKYSHFSSETKYMILIFNFGKTLSIFSLGVRFWVDSFFFFKFRPLKNVSYFFLAFIVSAQKYCRIQFVASLYLMYYCSLAAFEFFNLFFWQFLELDQDIHQNHVLGYILISGYAFLCIYPVYACSSFFPVDSCPLSNWGIFQPLILQVLFSPQPLSHSLLGTSVMQMIDLLPYIAEDLWLF